jgi:predicted O-linked N-acetylglucosamine transferase (SPINDLY family)
MNRKERRAAEKLGRSPMRPAAAVAPGRAMPDIASLLAAGEAHYGSGRLADAEACSRAILAAAPDHVDALFLLGRVAHAADRPDLAIDLFARALRGNERHLLCLLNHATALHEIGRFDAALAGYDRALAIEPGVAEIHFNRGMTLRALGRTSDALASFERAFSLRSDFAEAVCNHGVTLLALGRFEAALASCDKALALRPDYVEALHNRGVALFSLNRLDEALASYDRALAINPSLAETHSYRATVLHELGRLDAALAGFDVALGIRPDHADALDGRGSVLQALHRPGDALAFHHRALQLRPDNAEALNNLGCALQQLKRHEEAVAWHDKALALRPAFADALHNRGVALRRLKRLDEALKSFEQAVAVGPEHAKAFGEIATIVNAMCDFERRPALAADIAARISDGTVRVFPFAAVGTFDDPLLQRHCAETFVAERFSTMPPPMWAGGTWRNDRIRIAYLSADFHLHATAQLMAELFERHDRARFEVIAVSYGIDDGSAMRARLVAAFDRFIDVSAMSDEAAARLLHEMQVDIAVDLKGHTEDARPGILAFRPAPIQVNYLGYPGTIGASFIDYIITDPIITPFEHQPFYSERLVQLPDTYQANDTKREIAERTPTRQELGLPEQGFVFCCFNQTYKIAPDIFEVWMRLLRAVDGSVLWLFRDNEFAVANLRRAAEAHGIDPDRLVFAGRVAPADHLARYRLADLFLDTLPYNAHTTASEALWAGLPVVTQLGQAFAGRVAASLVSAVGLSELVTPTIGDYEARALRLATTPALLDDISARLAANRLMHPLFDADRFRRHIEQAYLTMWETWQQGSVPQSFAVAPEA